MRPLGVFNRYADIASMPFSLTGGVVERKFSARTHYRTLDLIMAIECVRAFDDDVDALHFSNSVVARHIQRCRQIALHYSGGVQPQRPLVAFPPTHILFGTCAHA